MKTNGDDDQKVTPSAEDASAAVAKVSVNDSLVRIEPTKLAPHVKVIVPARAARIYDRVE